MAKEKRKRDSDALSEYVGPTNLLSPQKERRAGRPTDPQELPTTENLTTKSSLDERILSCRDGMK
jgi:hypothetical protein